MGISEKIQRIIKKILKYISRMFSKTPKRKFYFGMFYKHCKVKDNVILVQIFLTLPLRLFAKFLNPTPANTKYITARRIRKSMPSL